MPLSAVQQLSFWMILWNRNELDQYHSVDAICCSHHKHQLVRSKTYDFSYRCLWNCHYYLKPSVFGHVNWQKDKPHGRRDSKWLKMITSVMIKPYKWILYGISVKVNVRLAQTLIQMALYILILWTLSSFNWQGGEDRPVEQTVLSVLGSGWQAAVKKFIKNLLWKPSMGGTETISPLLIKTVIKWNHTLNHYNTNRDIKTPSL